MHAALHGRSNHLGLVEGRMHRTACTHGLNLLVTYSEGCRANGAYSGLAWHREEARDYADRNFIRVDWPAVRFDKIIARVKTVMTENGSSACAFP